MGIQGTELTELGQYQYRNLEMLQQCMCKSVFGEIESKLYTGYVSQT